MSNSEHTWNWFIGYHSNNLFTGDHRLCDHHEGWTSLEILCAWLHIPSYRWWSCYNRGATGAWTNPSQSQSHIPRTIGVEQIWEVSTPVTSIESRRDLWIYCRRYTYGGINKLAETIYSWQMPLFVGVLCGITMCRPLGKVVCEYPILHEIIFDLLL